MQKIPIKYGNSMAYKKRENPILVGNRVPGWTPEVGNRLSEVVRHLGGGPAAGKIAGVSDEMISRYINGRAKPSVYAIAALAAAAGVSMEWVMAGEAKEHLPSSERSPLAIEVIKKIIIDLEVWLSKADSQMTPEAKARFVGQAYLICADEAQADGESIEAVASKNVENLLKLIA